MYTECKNRKALASEMEKIAKKNVKHYFSDFTDYDRPKIENENDAFLFIWIVRDCGTHLIKITNNPEELYNSYDYIRAIYDCWGTENLKTFQIQQFKDEVCTIEKINSENLRKDAEKECRFFERMLELKKKIAAA